MSAFVVAEEALAVADLDQEPGAQLDHALTIGLVEVISDWCSWPETPPEVVATIEAGMGPMTRERWDSVRGQGAAVATWIRNGGAAERTGATPAEYRAIENDDLRFMMRSTRHYIDETLAVGTADRLWFGEFLIAFVAVPDLLASASRQTYANLAIKASGARVRYMAGSYASGLVRLVRWRPEPSRPSPFAG